MLKPPTPNVTGMTDTLDFVKNLWGSMGIPGVAIPGMSGTALSTDDLDKKIADLKAIESWLNLNIGMLRGTIQALEVQRGTIATLQSMSASMAQAIRQPGAGDATAAPFAQFFAQPSAAQPSAAQPSTPQPGVAQSAAAAPSEAGQAAPAAALPAAVAWWNLLQDQFRQAVASAMSPDPMAGTAAAPAQGSKPAPSAAAGRSRGGKSKADKS